MVVLLSNLDLRFSTTIRATKNAVLSHLHLRLVRLLGPRALIRRLQHVCSRIEQRANASR